ncbi:hypothetical protein U9R90_06215 [Streptomyces sp. E11-3]|uniref:hypothetical protein n=1 Tax=Streptomyces sp. E11-3 TaxID=3110112 RepID=UPI0039815974
MDFSLSGFAGPVFGGVAVALVTFLSTRTRTRAEARKLDAEAERARAETTRILAEVQLSPTSSGGWEDLPKGWGTTGTNPNDYDFGVDRDVHRTGVASAFIRSCVGARPFGSLVQSFRADDYWGKRVRMTATLRSKDTRGYVTIWLRADDSGGRGVAFDNTQAPDKRVSGTTGWLDRSVVVDIPDSAHKILFGVILAGEGSAWVDEVKLEVVGTNVPRTTEPLRLRPINMDFSMET